MTQTPRLRSALDDIPAYKAGQPPKVREGVVSHKLSSNENPYPPIPEVLRAAELALESLNRYPDFASTALVEAIATRFNLPIEDVAVATGSVGLAQQLVQITSEPGDTVVFGWRAFEAYPIVTLIAGATSRPVPLDSNDRHDLDAMLAAIDHTTRLVFVCNPNNPTGTAVGREALERFLAAVPPDVLVVLDEAYREFVDPGRIPDGLQYYRQYPNVAVLRTFSKAHGLAALRVGFCIAHEPVAAALRKVQVPFGVSTVAQAAAIAALHNEGALLEQAGLIAAERDRVLAGLRSVGLTPSESEANFVWLRLGQQTSALAGMCDEAGLSVRPFADEGVRITVGTPAANDRLLEIAAEWVALAGLAGEG